MFQPPPTTFDEIKWRYGYQIIRQEFEYRFDADSFSRDDFYRQWGKK